MDTADYWIRKLQLQEHPEGGYYSEVYRNSKKINFVSGARNFATSIYFLLKGDQISHFHQLFSDELWYFHAGSEVTVHKLFNGKYEQNKLGLDNESDPQIIIKAGTIFAAEVMDKSSFSLMGCMVNPGFDFDDFRLIKKKELINKYPNHEILINRFTIS